MRIVRVLADEARSRDADHEPGAGAQHALVGAQARDLRGRRGRARGQPIAACSGRRSCAPFGARTVSSVIRAPRRVSQPRMRTSGDGRISFGAASPPARRRHHGRRRGGAGSGDGRQRPGSARARRGGGGAADHGASRSTRRSRRPSRLLTHSSDAQALAEVGRRHGVRRRARPVDPAGSSTASPCRSAASSSSRWPSASRASVRSTASSRPPTSAEPVSVGRARDLGLVGRRDRRGRRRRQRRHR